MVKLKRKYKTRTPRPRCSHPDCWSKSGQTQECLTCEALVQAGKADEIFTVHYCIQHAEPVQRQMRRHVYLAHPVNIPRAALAALRGEDIE